MSEILKRLEELEKKTTPAPWQTAWTASRRPIATAISTDGATDGQGFGLYGAVMVPLTVDADMEFIALLRNHAGHLIAVARAAEGLIRTDTECQPDIDEAWDAIRNALGKLKGQL